MKKTLLFILLFSFTTSCNHKFFHSSKAEYEPSEEFVQGSEDIPLLQGMEKIADDAIGFDTEGGSIINSTYHTQLDLGKIRNFYIKTLPSMGWQVIKNGRSHINLKRDKEKLEIMFKKQNGKNVVTFFIVS